MRRVDKSDYQEFLRAYPWHYHIVLDEHLLKKVSDKRALELLRRMCFFLCKRYLHRSFSKRPLEERFHWMAVFQGNRLYQSRHVHVLLYVPPGLWKEMKVLRRLRVNGAIESAWIAGRWAMRIKDGPLFVWKRFISDEQDNRAAATYVTRLVSPSGWNEAEVYFSQ